MEQMWWAIIGLVLSQVAVLVGFYMQIRMHRGHLDRLEKIERRLGHIEEEHDE